MAIERFDRRIGVQNPGSVKQWDDAIGQMSIQPSAPFAFRNTFQGVAQGVFGDDLVHTQEAGIDAVAADPGNVGVASMTRQHREHPGAQHLRLAWRIRAVVTQRTAFQPTPPHSSQIEKLDEVRQLPHRRGRALRLPAHLHSARHRLHPSARQQHFFASCQLQFRLTHRVTPQIRRQTIVCRSSRSLAHGQLRFLGSTIPCTGGTAM